MTSSPAGPVERHDVEAGGPVDEVAAVARVPDDLVVARVERDVVVAPVAVDHVAPGPGEHDVGARPAEDDVAAGAGEQAEPRRVGGDGRGVDRVGALVGDDGEGVERSMSMMLTVVDGPSTKVMFVSPVSVNTSAFGVPDTFTVSMMPSGPPPIGPSSTLTARRRSATGRRPR